jgi:hypothetical protein
MVSKMERKGILKLDATHFKVACDGLSNVNHIAAEPVARAAMRRGLTGGSMPAGPDRSGFLAFARWRSE